LTHPGHEFLRHTVLILAAVSSAEEALQARPDALHGELSIGATSPLTGYYLPSLLERYRRAFPKVQARIFEDAGHFIEHQLINGELDIALMVLSSLSSEQAFNTSVLVRSPWRLWVSMTHRLSERSVVSLAELREDPVVMLQDAELEAVRGDRWRDAGVRPREMVRTRSVEATRSLVATGHGVCLLPEVLFRSWSLEGERLVALPVEEPLMPLDIGLAWRRGGTPNSVLDGFIATAREHGQSSTRRSTA
jgi:DNA-binding transcriptional LysR family regulator